MSTDYLHRADLLMEQGRYQQAADALLEALAQSPNHPNALASLGWCQTKCGHFQMGEENVRRAIQLAPDNDGVHQAYALILGDQSRYAEAEAAIRRAIAIAPNWVRHRKLYAKILRFQGKYEEAIGAANAGLRLSPEDFGCIHEKMLAQYHSDDFPAIDQTIQIALRLDPENPDVHAALGYSHLSHHSLAGAAGAFRESLRLNPHSRWAQYGLSRCRIFRFPWYRWANGFRLSTVSGIAALVYGVFSVIIVFGVSLYLFLPPPNSPRLIEAPLLLFFPPVIATCAIEPMALWVLSWDREGKHLLLPLEKRIANVVVLLTVIALAAFVAGAFALLGKISLAAWPLFMLAFAIGAPIPPLSKYCDCEYGRPRQIMQWLIGIVAAIASPAALVALGSLAGWLDVSWNYTLCTALSAVMLPTLLITLYLTGYRLTE